MRLVLSCSALIIFRCGIAGELEMDSQHSGRWDGLRWYESLPGKKCGQNYDRGKAKIRKWPMSMSMSCLNKAVMKLAPVLSSSVWVTVQLLQTKMYKNGSEGRLWLMSRVVSRLTHSQSGSLHLMTSQPSIAQCRLKDDDQNKCISFVIV